ncbi:MAG: shufflon system plasmid conjugative transfer pilus tip adhesin PilV [Bacteroidia bacterium]
MKRLQYILAFLPFALLHLAESSSAQNVGIGTSTPAYKLHTIGDIYANGGWFRVSGNQGLYWESWGGGFYMSDATWIRTYNNKNIWTGPGLLGTDGGLTSGYGGTTPPGGGAIIAGFTGIGTASPSQRLSVQGNIEIMESFDNVLLSRNTAQARYHHVIGTYMGWDQGAIYIGGYNANNPSGLYSSAN